MRRCARSTPPWRCASRKSLSSSSGLAVVVSAEALFALAGLSGLEPDVAIASVAETARSRTAAAAGDAPG